MSSNMPTIEEDLAYLRRLVESDHGALAHRKFGFMPTRAFSAVFAGIGYSYLVMLTVLSWAAYERRNLTFIWLYAVVVFAGQGAGWYVFWTLRREAWIGRVAIGWYAAALLTGLNMQLPEFLLIAGFTLILLIGIPGWVMMRETATPAR